MPGMRRLPISGIGQIPPEYGRQNAKNEHQEKYHRVGKPEVPSFYIYKNSQRRWDHRPAI